MGRSMHRFYNPIARPFPPSPGASPAPPNAPLAPSDSTSREPETGAHRSPRLVHSTAPAPPHRRRLHNPAAGLQEQLRAHFRQEADETRFDPRDGRTDEERDQNIMQRVMDSQAQWSDERLMRHFEAQAREPLLSTLSDAKDWDEPGPAVQKYSEAPFDLDEDHPDAVFEAFLVPNDDGDLVPPPDPTALTNLRVRDLVESIRRRADPGLAEFNTMAPSTSSSTAGTGQSSAAPRNSSGDPPRTTFGDRPPAALTSSRVPVEQHRHDPRSRAFAEVTTLEELWELNVFSA